MVTMKNELCLIFHNKVYRRAYFENYILVPFFAVLLSLLFLKNILRLDFYGARIVLYYVVTWCCFLSLLYFIDFENIHKNNLLCRDLEKKYGVI